MAELHQRDVLERLCRGLCSSSSWQGLGLKNRTRAVLHPNVLRLPHQFQDVTDWSIGLEYYYNDVITLRAGYEPRSSVIPENRQDLLIPIVDANLYGLGIGYRMDAHTQLT